MLMLMLVSKKDTVLQIMSNVTIVLMQEIRFLPFLHMLDRDFTDEIYLFLSFLPMQYGDFAHVR